MINSLLHFHQLLFQPELKHFLLPLEKVSEQSLPFVKFVPSLNASRCFVKLLIEVITLILESLLLLSEQLLVQVSHFL